MCVCVCVSVSVCAFLFFVVSHQSLVLLLSKCKNVTNMIPFRGNFELRPLGVAMGNAVSVTRV